MARLNRSPAPIHTHEGARAPRISDYAQLRRAVLACMLWEKTFYENGEDIASRIATLAQRVDPEALALLADEARTEYKLRHAPLLLLRELARHPARPGRLVGDTIAAVIQRADELTEFLAIYWSDGKQPLSKQVKHGLSRALGKFDEYQLAKYDRKNEIRLRDVLFLTHAKPRNEAQAALWKRLADNDLHTPDTWEVALSAGEEKGATFRRLLGEKRLGYMALLRNLRNMRDAGIESHEVFDAVIEGAERSKALPFRFLSAARAVPQWEPMLDEAMRRALTRREKLIGRTALLVDVSYSMVGTRISARSDLDRLDAAAALAALLAGVCADLRIFAFSDYLAEVPLRKGMSLVDAIRAMRHGSTCLGQAVRDVNKLGADRLIVLTDEQSQDSVPQPVPSNAYMINVASDKNGVGYGAWTHIDGFSEAVIDWIHEHECEVPQTIGV